MKQKKANPNTLLKLQKTNKEHNSKYFEKKTIETAKYSFKDNEIKNYIYKIFENNELTVHHYKLYYMNSCLYIFVSYYFNVKLTKHSKQKIKILKNSNNYLITNNTNSFIKQLSESLSLFTNKKINIYLTLKQLNKNFKISFNKKKMKLIKKKLMELRKYKQNKFFYNGINLLFTYIKKTNSSKLLAQFIATQLQKLKRHNFFLRFIKNTLTFLSSKKFSKLKGVKIKIKGRFNGILRARHKIIKIGDVPILTIKSNIDYSEATSYTPNGTFGVKVWSCKNINN